jgi:hypothetical protein
MVEISKENELSLIWPSLEIEVIMGLPGTTIDLGEVIGLEEAREHASNATNKAILLENVQMVTLEEMIIEGIIIPLGTGNNLLPQSVRTEKEVNQSRIHRSKEIKKRVFLVLFLVHPKKDKIAKNLLPTQNHLRRTDIKGREA